MAPDEIRAEVHDLVEWFQPIFDPFEAAYWSNERRVPSMAVSRWVT